MNEVRDTEENNFKIEYKYCNNAYMVADERCVEVAWMLHNIKKLERKEKKVLDVGCAESRYINDLKSIGCDVYGNDIREVGGDTGLKGFFVGKIQEIETAITFDAIICISTLEHIGLAGYGSKREKPKNAQILALKNMSRLLDDDGFIYLSVPYGKKFVYYGGKRPPFIFRHRHKRPVPFVEYDRKLLKSIIDKSGLSIFKEEYYCWIWREWKKIVNRDLLRNVKYGDFNACNAAGLALLILRKHDECRN